MKMDIVEIFDHACSEGPYEKTINSVSGIDHSATFVSDNLQMDSQTN